MSPKNIIRFKIIYCIFWLAYPVWTGGMVQGALWGGCLVLDLLTQEAKVLIFALSMFVFIMSIIFAFMLPAEQLAEGVTWGRLLDLLDTLHEEQEQERARAIAQRRAEIEEAVRMAREGRP